MKPQRRTAPASRNRETLSYKVVLRQEPLLRTALQQALRVRQHRATAIRVEMTLTALRLQSYYGRNIASARYLAASALANEKTWDRHVAWLRDAGLARTSRRKREDGSLSTNTIDLKGLWYRLMRELKGLLWAVGYQIFSTHRQRGYVLFRCRHHGYYEELVVHSVGPPLPPPSI